MADNSVPRGRGLFRIPRPGKPDLVTNVRRLAGRDLDTGSRLIAVATVFLAVLGAGLLAVSFAAQRQYVLAARHESWPSIIEALSLDVAMLIFALLGLGLAKKGLPARTERAAVIICAVSSAFMNYLAADVSSPRSVAAYVMPPILLALAADRVIAVVRRWVLGPGASEGSAWRTAGLGLAVGLVVLARIPLYVLRIPLAPKSTGLGLRQWVLNATPLPAAPVAEAGADTRTIGEILTDQGVTLPGPGETKKDVLLKLYREHANHGNRELASKTATELAWRAELQPGTARTYIYQELESIERAGAGAIGMIDLILTGLAAVVIAGLVWRFTVSPQAMRANRSRALRWRIKFRLPLGRGYATVAELVLRWGKLAAVVSGRRARPDMPWWARLISSPAHYAVRLGRATFGKRTFARAEDQTLILAAPRTFKTAMLADRIIGHPGAALATSTRTDLYDATAGDRQARGPVWVFNPQAVGHVPSSFGWNPLDGCDNPAMAMLRAEAFIGQLLDGDMAFWQRKAIVGLAALLHAGALAPGATMADVYAWAGRHGDQLAEDVLAGAGASALPLLAAMRELRMATKTADSVRATITEALSWVTIPSVIEAVTPAPGFDLDPVEFARSCGTIYLMAPGGSATAPLFRAFTSYVQYEATLAGTRWAHKKLIPPLLLALDELHANPVPLPSWLADSAGKGVQIAAVVHDVGQLEELYGVAGARTVWGTTGTKIFFGGIHSDETLEKVSKLCGKVRHGSGETAREVEVAPVDFLRTLPTMRALILRMNLSPVVVKVRPVWKRWDRRLWRHAPLPRPLPSMPRATAIMPDPEPAEIPAPASTRPPARYRKASGE